MLSMLHHYRGYLKVAKVQMASSGWKTSLRAMQHVSGNSKPTSTLLPRPNYSQSQQGSNGKHTTLALAMLGTALAFSTAVGGVSEAEVEVLPEEEELTPLYEPVFREAGMLKVSDVHTISYKVYGNPRGKPVLCVHGGPGAGTGTGKVIICVAVAGTVTLPRYIHTH
mgnify:CR=1 FL=1